MAYRKGLVLSFGLVNVIVSIDGAVGSADSLVTVCCGRSGDPAHVPTPIHQERKCKTCAALDEHNNVSNPGLVEYSDLKKAREIGSGQYQIADQQEVAATKDAVLGATKKMLTLEVHDASEVNESVLQGDGVYFISPDGAAQIGAYSLLYDGVKRHTDKAFTTQFTPSSSASFWQLKAFHGVLVMEKRCWPEQVKAVPSVPVVEPDAGLQAQMDMVIDSMVKPFDPNTYRDEYAASLDALLASKGTVEGEVAERKKAAEKTVSTAGVVDLTAALSAMLQQAQTPAPPAKKAAAARKAKSA